ncbi:type II 3-dehydroquinate dehydratase [Salipaludibacillus aurantiacus]|uniref:3-dehydroquinate dehydratase n=1 Tax=Salipaludibacillus aurantiacus TaxID=1601833 RepID=A0A1H9PPD6_9BACI|nr:type II 3-dehydroquinate dehydratase [Salipaludibacillus aurantiacus]SER49423.1 3-dehydroquinate dehydratase [Salipaludibacillus aurantiacus]
MDILILNGPNLNRLGKREPDIYGTVTLKDIEKRTADYGSKKGITVTCKQSNWEGQLIDWIHEAAEKMDGIIINPGAFTHYSYAIRDAVASIDVPVIEVHISNIHAREDFRKNSVIAPVSGGQISGFGPAGYEMAIDYLVRRKNV